MSDRPITVTEVPPPAPGKKAGTHAAAAVGGTAFGAALAGVISSTWHLDPAVAGQWVTVLAGVAGFAGIMITWFFSWKWPNIPPPPFTFSAVVPSNEGNSNEHVS